MRARLLGWLACQLFRWAFRVGAHWNGGVWLTVRQDADGRAVDFGSGPYQTSVTGCEVAP